MCRSPLHPFLAALPKCEHHMHLEGSLSPTLLFELATRNTIALPSSDPAFTSPTTLLARYNHFTSLDDFLHYYYLSMSTLLHAADFELLAYSYFQRAHADNVHHAEVFFDPQAHTTRGVPYATVIEGFTRACKRAEKELGMSVLLIMCFLRHLPVAESQAMLVEAEADLKSGVVAGIGLDSSEKGNPPSMWREVYASARKIRVDAPVGATGEGREGGGGEVKRTAHAGEEGPVEYIREALQTLDIERIDHGIRLADDSNLMREVAERKLLVTLCPLSNVRLRCVKDVKELPIRKFLDHGVRFSINSDDPAYFGGYILDNYCAVQEAFGLRVEEWRGIAMGAVEGSWCGEGRKGELREGVERVVGEFGYLKKEVEGG